MLTAYQTALQNLIQTPQNPSLLVTTAQQTTFINAARTRVAGEGECTRDIVTLPLVIGQQRYPFSSITGYPAGMNATLSVRQAWWGFNQLDIRPWEYFSAYYLFSHNNGIPARLAQHHQGELGSLFFDPVPDAIGIENLVVLYIVGAPTPLATDGDPEVIPAPWTDAVPFYAAWLAFMNLQRQADADRMMAAYGELMRRSRQEVTPSVLPDYTPGGQGAVMAAAHQPIAPVGGGGGGRGR